MNRRIRTQVAMMLGIVALMIFPLTAVGEPRSPSQLQDEALATQKEYLAECVGVPLLPERLFWPRWAPAEAWIYDVPAFVQTRRSPWSGDLTSQDLFLVLTIDRVTLPDRAQTAISVVFESVEPGYGGFMIQRLMDSRDTWVIPARIYMQKAQLLETNWNIHIYTDAPGFCYSVTYELYVPQQD